MNNKFRFKNSISLILLKGANNNCEKLTKFIENQRLVIESAQTEECFLTTKSCFSICSYNINIGEFCSQNIFDF